MGSMEPLDDHLRVKGQSHLPTISRHVTDVEGIAGGDRHIGCHLWASQVKRRMECAPRECTGRMRVHRPSRRRRETHRAADIMTRAGRR